MQIKFKQEETNELVYALTIFHSILPCLSIIFPGSTLTKTTITVNLMPDLQMNDDNSVNCKYSLQSN